MGIQNGRQVIFKMTNVVSRELRSLLNDVVFKDDCTKNTLTQYRIDCDISNILHLLSFRHNKVFTLALVRDVAEFLKELAADTGFIVTAVLDGDVRPQSKRDAFKRRFEASINRINAFYCRQSAMKIACLHQKTKEEKEMLDKYNKMAKKLDSTRRLEVPFNLKYLLSNALHEISAYNIDNVSGGFVNHQIIQAQFEADYIIAYRFRYNLSDCIYSTNADMTALCGPKCISIWSFKNEKRKTIRNKDQNNGSYQSNTKVYELTGCSNQIIQTFQQHIQQKKSNQTSSSHQNSTQHINHSNITFEPAKYPIFEESDLPAYLIALYAVGMGCDVIPGGISGITPLVIYNSTQDMFKGKNAIERSDFAKRYRKLVDLYVRTSNNKQITDKCIRTYMQAWMYQPALEFGKEEDKKEYKYVFHEPITLSPYLHMFAHPNGSTTIDGDSKEEEKDKTVTNEDCDLIKKCCGEHILCNDIGSIFLDSAIWKLNIIQEGIEHGIVIVHAKNPTII